MKKPTIFLHIGHGKTGTSATQHLLAAHADRLADLGICYPKHPNSTAAEMGQISSGNLVWSPGVTTWFDATVLPTIAQSPGFSGYVFSSENMFWTLGAQIPAMLQASDRFEFKIVLAVRDPLEMELSAYGQQVKRAGYSGDIEDKIDQPRHLLHAEKLLKQLAEAKIPVCVLNYSVLKRRISTEIFAQLGIDTSQLEDITPGKQRTVNRSLSHEEMKLMKSFNRYFDKSVTHRCCDALVNELPDIAAEPVPVSPAIVARFFEYSKDAVDYLNTHLPEDQRLSLTHNPNAQTPARMSSEQLDVFFRALRAEFDNVQPAPPPRSKATDAWLTFRDGIRRRLGVID